MLKSVAVIGWVLGAIGMPATAATFQLVVSGEQEYALIGQANTEEGERLGFLEITENDNLFDTGRYQLAASGYGSLVIETDVLNPAGGLRPPGWDIVSDCTGILVDLCSGSFGSYTEFDTATGNLRTNGGDSVAELNLGPFLVGSVGSLTYNVETRTSIVGSGGFYDGAVYSSPFQFGGPAYEGEYSGDVSLIPFFPDIAVRYNLTTYEISAVPLSPSLSFLALGIGGLAFVGRRRKGKHF